MRAIVINYSINVRTTKKKGRTKPEHEQIWNGFKMYPYFTMASSGGWCTIDFYTGVFTNIVESPGFRGSEFAELWSLDDNYLRSIVSNYGEIYGLIFLFK